VEARAEEPVAAVEPAIETPTAPEAVPETAVETPSEPAAVAATEPAAEPEAPSPAAEAREALTEAPVEEHAAEVVSAEPEASTEEAVEIEAIEEVATVEPEVVAEVAPAPAEEAEPEPVVVEAEAEPQSEAAIESVEAEPAAVVAEAVQQAEPEPTMDEPEPTSEAPTPVEADAVVEAVAETAPEPEAESVAADEAAPAEETAAVPSEETAAEPGGEPAPVAAAEETPAAETNPEASDESDAEAGIALIETIAEEPEAQAEIVLEADPDVTSYEAAAQAAPVEDAEGHAETVAAVDAGDESTEASATAGADTSSAADSGASAASANTGSDAAAAIEAAPAAAEPPVAEAAPAHPHKQLIKLEAKGDDASPFSLLVEEVYDGPLDLLLDLIRKQDIDIYDIPIARITAQFLAYVNQLKAGDVDVAGEFIYTASLLIHIKSKMLLPRTGSGPEEADEDPRRELVDRLLEHERFKNAAQMLQQKQMLEAATWTNPGFREFQDDDDAEPEIAADTVDLVRVFRDILERARTRPVLDVQEDSVTVGQMVQFLVRRLTMEDKPVALRRLLSHTHSERALIAMFLALLELVRMQAILLRQDLAFSEIFIKKNSGFEAVLNQGLANAQDDWR
jgi:segregation and condensation protein A